jgi:hypothetical protein
MNDIEKWKADKSKMKYKENECRSEIKAKEK